MEDWRKKTCSRWVNKGVSFDTYRQITMRTWLSQIFSATIMVSAMHGVVPAEIKAQENQVVAYAMPGPIGSVLIQPDGKIVAMGCGYLYFRDEESGTVGQVSASVARFKPDGSLDFGFGCRANLPVSVSVFEQHLSSGPDGRMLAAGSFVGEGGLCRSGLAMLSPEGTRDKGFAPWCGDTNELSEVMPKPWGGLPFHLATFDANGQIAVSCLTRNPQTSELRAFTLDDRGCVLGRRQPEWAKAKFPASLFSSLQETGFSLFRPVGWSNPERTAWSLNPAKTWSYYFFCMAGDPPSAGDAAQILQAIFAEFPLELCNNAARLPDGGAILLVQDGGIGRFMRFDRNWLPVLSYTNTIRARGYMSLVVQKDGKLLVARGSDLHDISGSKPGDVVRLNADGSIDRSFRCDTDERVMCMAVQDDGRILIGGFFSTVNGTEAARLARLNQDGTLDRSFKRSSTDLGNLFVGRRMPVRRLANPTPDQPVVTRPEPRTTAPETSAQSVLITSLIVAEGTATISYRGAPNQTYILQACNALSTSEWFNVFTNRADANGAGMLADRGVKETPSRFYRVAAP